MEKQLINRIIEYLEDGLCIQYYSGERPYCECCKAISGSKHKDNCELNNILTELRSME